MKEEVLKKEEYPARSGCLYILLFSVVMGILGVVIHILKQL